MLHMNRNANTHANVNSNRNYTINSNHPVHIVLGNRIELYTLAFGLWFSSTKPVVHHPVSRLWSH